MESPSKFHLALFAYPERQSHVSGEITDHLVK